MFSVSSSDIWNITMIQASNQQPILSCRHTTLCFLSRSRTRCTPRLSEISSFIQAALYINEDIRTPTTYFLLSRTRSSASRRHHRRRDEDFASHLKPKEKPHRPDKVQLISSRRDSPNDEVVITLDTDGLKHTGADALVVVQREAERTLDKVVLFAKTAARESEMAWRELRTSVRVEKDKHVVISVKRSTLEFAGKAVLGSILLVAFTKLFVRALREYRWGWEEGFSRSKSVVRDRSLGGKEITLSRGLRLWEGCPAKKAVHITRGLKGPLDGPSENSRSEKELLKSARARGESALPGKKTPRLPGWWPEPDLPPSSTITRRQRIDEEANRLVQGIVQRRLIGYDFAAGDTLQLRQLCKEAGAKVKFDTHNTRDSFYRAAINLVLNACQSAGKWSMVNFGSEGGIRFIAGLACNIGLESDRAATMVNAAVAVRTRAGLLQARALQMQSKFSESEEELLKLIRLHSCFPPDHNSAEMEMVAHGLGSYFDREARVEILQLYEKLGGKESKRVAEEALGLLLTG